MRDYSEFEEEEEVDLQNLIGSKSKGTSSAMSASSMGGSYKPSPSGSASATQRGRAATKDDNEFDVDF